MSRLTAETLSFGYGVDPLLERIDFQARPGEVTAVVGSNGVGKTTLLKLLAGHLSPTVGRVLLDGEPIAGRPRRLLAQQIALSPQFETPTWRLTVRQTVELGRAPHRGWFLPFQADDHRAVDRALGLTDLSALAERTVTELSGGELRRVLFARILAQSPRVVLLDEPTAHLDLKHQEEVCRLMRALADEQGCTVVVSLHDLNQAAAYADRIALLHGGRILAFGNPEDVLTSDHIEQAFGIAVDVARHPASDRLWVTPKTVRGVNPEASPAPARRDSP